MARPTRSHWRLTAFVLAAVLLTTVARWPLAWTTGWLQPDVRCDAPAGSLWNGTCGALTVGTLELGNAAWQVHPWRLLRGSLSATIQSTHGADFVKADVDLFPGGRRVARNLEARLTLGQGMLRQGAMGLRGALHATFARVSLQDRVVRDLTGTVTVRQLTQASGQPTLLGDFELVFPDVPAGEGDDRVPRGSLRDLGGPLGVTGTLTLTGEPGYVIDGFVTTRTDTPTQLARQIAILGTPDAAGRRPFSLAGTY